MIDRLKNELLKISKTRDTFQYIQNKNEFLSIVFELKTSCINAFISVDYSPKRCSNTAIDMRLKSIAQDRQMFADGSTFESHFGDDRRIAMTNLQYDIETRILTGEIVWPTTYFGSKTWEYEIEFDLCFEKIINGSIDKYNESGELFDCYPLCDPSFPDQDFKLKIETIEPVPLTKRKSEWMESLFCDSFLNEIDGVRDYLLALFTDSRQLELFGLKLSNLDVQNSHNNLQIRLMSPKWIANKESQMNLFDRISSVCLFDLKICRLMKLCRHFPN